MEHGSLIESAMLVVGLLLATAILATRLSARLGFPALILFLATGMLAGSEGLGGIWFDDPALTWSVGVAALALLLFAGGLETDARHIRPVLAPGVVLATVGVAVSTSLTALFWSWMFERPLAEGVLLGAIVSSTDAAAVFSVLRASGVSLRGRIQPLLEMESGSNDPVAIFLTLAATAALAGTPVSPGAIGWGLTLQMGVGAAVGWFGGMAISWAIGRLRVSQEGLYPVFACALSLAVFGAAALLHGSGFLAIYVAGIVLAARPMVHRRAILRFHDALAWLAQIAMFVLLGLLVFPSHLPGVAARGVAIAAFLLFVARPIAVAIALTPFRVPLREQAMVSWVGLRGAVPIVLATWPRVMGVDGSEEVFDVVFFVVVLSVLVQGVSLPWVARTLGVAVVVPPEPEGQEGARVWTVDAGDRVHGSALVQIDLPPGVLVVLIERAERNIVPQGGTQLCRGDRLSVIGGAEQGPMIRRAFGAGSS